MSGSVAGGLAMPIDPASLMAGLLAGAATTFLALRLRNRRRPRAGSEEAAGGAPDGDLAHELRTPLSSIAAFAELMEDSVDPEERARFAGIIRQEAARMDAMIGERVEGPRGAPGPRPPAAGVGAVPARDLAARQILVVDDDRFIVEATRLLLEKEGYRAASAGDGAEALRLAREQAPDLILMDLTMPAMDGAEALRRLREDDRTRGIPVILTTGHGEAGAHAGAAAVLVKPIARAALLSAVARALSGGAST